MSTNIATPQQIKALNATISRLKLNAYKADIVQEASAGRTTSSKELTMQEARSLLAALNKRGAVGSITSPSGSTGGAAPSQKMLNKIFAMAHEMGWIKQVSAVGKNGLETKKDYSRLHGWVLKYGYLHKPLNQYSYAELPKLLYQLEYGVYKEYLSKL